MIDDDTKDIDKSYYTHLYPTLIWLISGHHNPYKSRNIGISRAKGQVIAFIDAKGVPQSDWIQNALEHILIQGQMIIAGRYHVIPDSTKLKDKVYSLFYLNNDKNVQKDYGVTCGNLFVCKSVFNTIGLFDTDHISGNDIKWSKMALKKGYTINYRPDVSIDYPGQSYCELQQSVLKYISGIGYQEKDQNRSFVNKLNSLVRYSLPMRYNTFRTAIHYRDLSKFPWRDKCYLWLLIWNTKKRMARAYLLAWMYQTKKRVRGNRRNSEA